MEIIIIQNSSLAIRFFKNDLLHKKRKKNATKHTKFQKKNRREIDTHVHLQHHLLQEGGKPQSLTTPATNIY